MNLSRVIAIAIVSLAALLALGQGCASSQQEAAGGASEPPVKEIPAVNNPVVQYNFYEPKTEEGLRRDTNYGYLIAKARPGFKTAAFERMGFDVIGSMAANGAIYYHLYKESDVLPALNRAKRHASLVFIEPEMLHTLDAVETNPIIFDNMDRCVADRSQYSAYTVKAYDAWVKYGFGPNKPIVASIDSGVRWRHEDLMGQVKHAYSWYLPAGAANWTNHAQIEGGIPLDAPRIMSLLPDMTLPYNGVMYYSTDAGGGGHGTHTSGTIIASGNNGAGGAGICWNAELIHYKGFNSSNTGTNWSLYGSIWHLARWKEANNYTAAIPVNFSIGGPVASQFGIDMIAHGLQNDIILVASAGNNGQRMVQYPAALSGVLTVGASTGADKKADFSCWGPHISVVAPGEAILSTISNNTYTNTEHEYVSGGAVTPLNNTYAWMSGTSMSAPHVTGLIGYMLNFNPYLKPDQIKTYIEQNADFIDGKTGFSEEYGWGRINVLKTIEAVINDVNNNAAPPSNYAINPVKIKPPISLSGLNVYLYSCNTDGSVQNYVASSIVGEYLAGIDPETGQGIENNTARFEMLRPGRYIARAFLGSVNKVAGTEPFTVEVNMPAKEIPLAFDAEMLTVQTFYTKDIGNLPNLVDAINDYVDTCIEVYDSADNLLYEEDMFLVDNLIFPEPSAPGEYYIRIFDYDGDANVGEYAFWFTNSAIWTPDNDNDWIELSFGSYGTQLVPIAPGTYANPLRGSRSAQATSRAAAQSIDARTNRGVFYGRFNDSAGSSGATGHWYKFTVAAE